MHMCMMGYFPFTRDHKYVHDRIYIGNNGIRAMTPASKQTKRGLSELEAVYVYIERSVSSQHSIYLHLLFIFTSFFEFFEFFC